MILPEGRLSAQIDEVINREFWVHGWWDIYLSIIIRYRKIGKHILKPWAREFTTYELGHPLFFFVYRRMHFLILGRSVGLKKKKKTHKKSRNSRPWYPRMTLKVNIHIFGLTKSTIYCEKCSCFCSCFSLCCYYAHFSD